MNFVEKDVLAMSDTDLLALVYYVLHGYTADSAQRHAAKLIAACHDASMSPSGMRSQMDLAEYDLTDTLENWSFDSTRIEQDFSKCLLRSVKYGNRDGQTSRIIACDPVSKRVLTQSGSVYQLVLE